MFHKKDLTVRVQLVSSAVLIALLSACAGGAPAPAAPPTMAVPTAVATTATETEATSAPTDAPAATEAPATAQGTGEMRKLQGKLAIAVEGALPVEGAPETAGQKAWREFLAKYKEYQPNVEVVIEDLPQGQTGEQWCEIRKQAKQLPDISWVSECN